MAINTYAKVYLAGGRGAYVGFPYPLRKVSAQVVVENDDVIIDHLVGRGPHGHSLSISGMLEGTDDDAGVDLKVQASQLPIDSYLIDALPPATRKGVSRLFDSLAFERLSKAGMLVNESDVTKAQEAAIELQNAIHRAQLEGDTDALSRYRDTSRRLDAIVAAGEFSLGGLASIDLNVHRARGKDVQLIVEGTLDIQKVGTLFDQFPYPLIATHGQINLQDESIIISEPGISFTTPTGGTGRISGRIDIPRQPQGGRKTLPDISFLFTDDLINPVLLAAVPPESDHRVTPATMEGWPGQVRAEAVIPIIELGVGGLIDCHARIQSSPDDSTNVHATISMHDGWLKPSRSIALTTSAGKGWPRGLELEDCEAILVVEPEKVSLRNFNGHRGEGVFTANGTFNRTDDSAKGRMEFTGIDIEPYMKDLFSDTARPLVDELHSSWQTRGTIDGTFDWLQTKGNNATHFTLKPQEVTFNVGNRTQKLLRESGEIIITDGVVDVSEFVVKTELDESDLRIRGSIALDPNSDEHQLDVDFSDMSFSAPLVEEALRLSAGDAFGTTWHDREPQGGFHGAISIESSPSNRVEVALVPNRFTMLSDPDDPKSRSGGNIEPGAIIHYDDGDLKIGPLVVNGHDNSLLNIEAQAMDLTGTPSASATWRMRAPSSQVPETRFLPPPLSLIIGTEGITTGPMDAHGHIEMHFVEGSEIPRTFDSTAHLKFSEGTINLGGVSVDDMEGTTDLRVRTADGRGGDPGWPEQLPTCAH